MSLSSVRSTVSRTRAASVRTAVQRSGVSAWSVAARAAGSVGRAASRRTTRSSGVTPSAKAASTGLTRRSNAWACWTAMASAWAAVKSYWGADAVPRGLARGGGQERALVLARARREHVRRGGLAHLELRLGGQEVQAQDHGHRDDQHRRGRDQAARVAAGEADRRLRGLGEHLAGSAARG